MTFIHGMELDAIDNKTGKVYTRGTFNICRIKGFYYGVINENSTDRKFLELRATGQSKITLD